MEYLRKTAKRLYFLPSSFYNEDVNTTVRKGGAPTVSYVFPEKLKNNSEYGFCIYHHTINGDYPLHWHEFYELEYVLSGSGVLHLNGTDLPFKKGSLMFGTPADLQRMDVHEKVEVCNISFTRKWIDEKLIRALSYGTLLPDYDLPLDAILREYEYTEKDQWNDRCLYHLLNNVLIDVIRQIEKDEQKGFHTELFSPIMRAVRYIDIHFREELTLEDVAREVGLSASYFSAQFHKVIGQTFKSYLVEVRLNYAANLVAGSDTRIAEICQSAGFGDFANFSRAFKKTYGMSPAAYRVQYGNGASANSAYVVQQFWEGEKTE